MPSLPNQFELVGGKGMVATALPSASEPVSFEELWTAYRRSLVARRRAPGTIERYEYSLRLWHGYSVEQGWPTAPAEWQRSQLEDWISTLIQSHAPATVSGHYRALRTFCRWLVDEDELDVSPMARMRAPTVPVVPPPVVDADTIGRLLEAAKGRGLEERRDTAIILLLSATGMRRGELVGMKVSDIDLEQGTAVISGKTGTRTVPFPAAVCVAIDRYLRARAQHRRAALAACWLGHFGPLTGNGIAQLLQRRARIAGVTTHIHPHLFRHTACHNLLAAGMREMDVESLLGWSGNGAMVRRYGASMRSERAINSYRQLFT